MPAPDTTERSTMTTATTTEFHGVFATLASGEKVKVAGDLMWSVAQNDWTKRDDARRAGLYPHVRHFEVRSMDDPAYRDLPEAEVKLVKPGQKGKNAGTAARQAWKAKHGKLTPNGATQGTGGWFYTSKGDPAVQGLDGPHGLVARCKRQGLIVEGRDGKWYVTGAPLPYVQLDRTEREWLLSIGREAGDLESAANAMFDVLLNDDRVCARFEDLDAVTISDYTWAAARFCFPSETRWL